MTKLSIIILSYNTNAILKQCLESIYRYPPSDSFELIVVDNASSDGSSQMVLKHFNQVKLIQLQSNRGFAAGNNAGLKVSRGEYVMFLNSDTQIKAETLDQLIKFMDTNAGVGMVTPKVLLPDGSIDLACHRGFPTPWNALTYFTRLESLFPNFRLFGGYHQTWKDFNTTHTIDATAATAIIVRVSTIKQVGELDEQFFLYAEDLDWCKRFKDSGWDIVYYPHVTVLHHKSASGKKRSLMSQSEQQQKLRQESIRHFYATMKQFYEKHYSQTYPKWLRRLVYLGIDLKQKLHK